MGKTRQHLLMTEEQSTKSHAHHKHTWTPDRLCPRAKRARTVTFLLLESKERQKKDLILRIRYHQRQKRAMRNQDIHAHRHQQRQEQLRPLLPCLQQPMSDRSITGFNECRPILLSLPELSRRRSL